MAQDSQVPAAGSLFDRVAHTPAVQSLAQRLERGGALSWPGVCPAAQPFLAALLHALFPKRALVVVTDGLKTQEAFQQDLQTWLQMKTNVNGLKPRATSTQSFLLRTQPLFYPAWEVLPHEGRLPHADAISDRLETLVTLSRREEPETEESPIIVTSVTALLQRTFPPETLRDRTRVLERGDRANPLDLVEWLEEQGYEPEAQVTQKGEMALRGGILDVFPPTNPWPVRLEFFGDELESLREFDPLTQISRGEVAAVTLPPAGELGILKRDLERGSATHSKSNPSIASSCGSTIGAPLATFLQHLPDSAIFLLCEPEQLAVRADEYAAHVPAGDPFLVEWNALLVELDRREMTRVDFSEVPFALISGLPPGERENLWPTHDKPATDGDSASTESSRRGERLSPSPAGEISPNPDSRFEPPNRNRRREEADSSELQRCPPPHVGGYKRRDRGEGKGERESSFEQCAADVPNFTSLDAFRPVSERAPDPQIAEAQRREFFNQLHRWLRQGFDLHVFCNNAGERQRFEEIWSELAGPAPRLAPVEKHSEEVSVCCDACPTLHIGALSRGFLLGAAKLVVVTDAEIFGRYKVQRPRRLKSPHAAAMRSALEIDFADLEYGDLVVHLQYGIGRYLGLKMLPAGAGQRPSALGDPPPETECLVIEYAPGDPAHEAPKLYVPVSESHLVSKYVGAGRAHPPLNTLGGTRWRKAKEQAAQAVRDVAAELLRIQAAREAQAGHAFKPDAPWQREFESAFIYEETPDQFRAIGETKLDMEKPKPMDRLICGDVGFGKTEVAIRAAFKAVMDGKQVAVLVPTTVLAQQHFNVFRERMADYPVRLELLSRFRTRRQQQRVVSDLANGSVDIVIGTHRLIQEDIAFKDLGLVVIDEEQRFGVLHKEKFKRLRTLVDVLTLSATPIPRTLYLALTGARDMSTIQTPPHDRLPVETIVTEYDERIIRDAIQRELNRGGQVFFLHNRVMTIQTMQQKLQQLVPHARIVVGHGQMHADDLEEVMTRFVDGDADVLLSTTIIESGLDIPNANTIIIDRADRFGLSDLYQLRGRVGRYKHQAYAYLLLPRHARLLTDVRKRISAMKQYSTLGSGFKIAMRDLEIRGAGNLLGAEQSGHITAVGFELYCQLLKQSVGALKGERVKPRVEVAVRLDFLDMHASGEVAPDVGQTFWSAGSGDFPVARFRNTELESPVNRQAGKPALPRPATAALPHSYVPEAQHRIEIYRKLAQATDKAALEAFQKELRDRFGPPPPPVELLLAVTDLKLLAGERNVTVIEVKEDKLMLTRHNDFITLGGKFPRLTKPDAKGRVKEIKRLLLAL